MKIVTYNIQFGLGKDGRFDLERIAGEVSWHTEPLLFGLDGCKP